MRAFLLASSILIFLITTVDGFQCYLCRGMQSSLDVCDNKIEKAHCKTHAPGADRCGIFSFMDGSTGSGFTAKAVSTRRLAMIKIIFARLSLQIWAMLKNARSYAAQKNSAITTTLLTHRNLTPVTTRISMITKTLKSAIGLMRVVP
ncbi:hypothetical protein ABFA07_002452 [Porites harrisoni]